jgi:protein TonB
MWVIRWCFLLFLLSIFFCLFSGFKTTCSYAHTSNSQKDTTPVQANDSTIFETIEVEPSVNKAEWISHLEKKLQPVVESAAAAGMKPGKYQVDVRFIVEKDGTISSVKALNDPGFGVARGAVRVVRTGPKWSPGMQNGRVVRSYHTQPLIFMISK